MRLALRTGIASVLLLAFIALSSAVGLACNKNFKVYNKTDKTMVKFFVSPYQSDDWEDNVLRSDVEPDTKIPVDMSDDNRNNSLYDVKAVFDDGTKSEGYKINLCRAAQINIYDDKVTYIDAQQ
jgi:hypothetical protein